MNSSYDILRIVEDLSLHNDGFSKRNSLRGCFTLGVFLHMCFRICKNLVVSEIRCPVSEIRCPSDVFYSLSIFNENA